MSAPLLWLWDPNTSLTKSFCLFSYLDWFELLNFDFGMQEELRAPHESQHGDAVMESIVKERNGSVLGKGSILKMYFFPGQRTSNHMQIHGAPHVYKVLSTKMVVFLRGIIL